MCIYVCLVVVKEIKPRLGKTLNIVCINVDFNIGFIIPTAVEITFKIIHTVAHAQNRGWSPDSDNKMKKRKAHDFQRSKIFRIGLHRFED